MYIHEILFYSCFIKKSFRNILFICYFSSSRLQNLYFSRNCAILIVYNYVVVACLINLGGDILKNISKIIIATLIAILTLTIIGLYYWLIFIYVEEFIEIIIIIMTAIIAAIFALFIYNFISKNSELQKEKLKIKSEETKKAEEIEEVEIMKNTEPEKEDVFVDISNSNYSENSEDFKDNDYDYMTI